MEQVRDMDINMKITIGNVQHEDSALTFQHRLDFSVHSL